MKNKLAKKLMLINTLIVLFALIAFFSVVTFILTTFMKDNIKEQLLSENKSAYRIAALSNNGDDEKATDQPVMYNNLTDSICLIYSRRVNQPDYELIYNNDSSFVAPKDTNEFLAKINSSENRIIQADIDGKDYLCTISRSSGNRLRKRNSIAVVSLISLDDVKSITNRYIIALIITSIILIMITVVLISIFSRRITVPIVKLTRLTKLYSKREFDKKYIAKTNDELEELSLSINKMAHSLKRHDEEKSRLFRHISHELKTPLTAIYGYAEGIKTNIFDDNDEPLDIIMSESLRIKKLTEDIIFLSKLESSIEKFEFEQLDLSPVIEKAIRSIESIAILNDIDIMYQPIKTSKITIDKDKIFRAIVNILSNCIKHTNDLIEIFLSQDDDNVIIAICDNGDGFKKSDVENIMQGVSKEKMGGSGIGLSIVRQIIKAHGGRLVISNRKDQGGAMFKIFLSK